MSKHGFPTTPTSEYLPEDPREGDASLVFVGKAEVCVGVLKTKEENSGTWCSSATCQRPTPEDLTLQPGLSWLSF